MSVTAKKAKRKYTKKSTFWKVPRARVVGPDEAFISEIVKIDVQHSCNVYEIAVEDVKAVANALARLAR